MGVKNSPTEKREDQKEFIRLFKSLVGRYTKAKIWSDFVVMSALAISNVQDKREGREKQYMEISKNYSKEELEVFASMLAETVMALERNPDQDFLGEMFMSLELGNDYAGQFFTPYCVCKCMADLDITDAQDKIDEHGWISVYDPACGAGATLVAAANKLREDKINYQQSALFVAQDIDYTVAMMCYIQLSLLGCPGYVYIGDTLAHPCTCVDDQGMIPSDLENTFFTPLYFSQVWSFRRMFHKFDKILEGSKNA